MGLGLAFEIQRVGADATLVSPPDNRSLICLVTSGRGAITITLPPAETATSRFMTVQRLDKGRKILIRAAGGEMIDGAGAAVVMEDRFDAVTFVTDGTEWVVFSRR